MTTFITTFERPASPTWTDTLAGIAPGDLFTELCWGETCREQAVSADLGPSGSWL